MTLFTAIKSTSRKAQVPERNAESTPALASAWSAFAVDGTHLRGHNYANFDAPSGVRVQEYRRSDALEKPYQKLQKLKVIQWIATR